jgi:hypothetical protein
MEVSFGQVKFNTPPAEKLQTMPMAENSFKHSTLEP